MQFKQEARESLKRGINILADAVVTTLGPKGRNVALNTAWDGLRVLHDGVSIAKEIVLDDPFENTGAQLVKQASEQTADLAGDGTTTSTLLAREMYNLGFEAVTEGVNPMILKRGIDKAIDAVVKELEKMAEPIPEDNLQKIKQVAVISSQDEKLGSLIAEAVVKVGKTGVIDVQEGAGSDVELKYSEGMSFAGGYLDPNFATDRMRMEADSPNTYILITTKRITAMQDIIPLFKKLVAKEAKHLVILCEELSGEALAAVVVNYGKGIIFTLPLKTVVAGEHKKALLEDIAVLTGGTVITEELGKTWETIDIEDLGQAQKVWADKYKTSIIGGKGSTEKIQERIVELQSGLANKEYSEKDKEILRERLARLTTGVAVISVGGRTDVEMRDKKERVIDAVAATKAALEEGIVAGGGVALLRARKAIYHNHLGGEERVGQDIVYDALEKPLFMIAYNSGENAKEVVETVGKHHGNIGFDCISQKYEDMLAVGIIDPAKVVRVALQNAGSVVGAMLTTEAIVVEKPEQAGGSTR
ncbi:MAG: chaperonin GroEL [Thaumarchaeota archaeon]|nr:chaperonin GroEL [Nitrososphaerota archaeon]